MYNKVFSYLVLNKTPYTSDLSERKCPKQVLDHLMLNRFLVPPLQLLCAAISLCQPVNPFLCQCQARPEWDYLVELHTSLSCHSYLCVCHTWSTWLTWRRALTQRPGQLVTNRTLWLPLTHSKRAVEIKPRNATGHIWETGCGDRKQYI